MREPFWNLEREDAMALSAKELADDLMVVIRKKRPQEIKLPMGAIAYTERVNDYNMTVRDIVKQRCEKEKIMPPIIGQSRYFEMVGALIHDR